MTGAGDTTAFGRNRLEVWIFAGIIAAASAVRAIPIGNDFWLDEIWTYYFALDLNAASEVFTRNHHSNNHHLNSLIFHWFGDQANWAVYRIPALVAGVGSVAIAALLAGRHGRLEGLLAAGLFGACFTLVHFSSEARGYSYAVFFALAATWFLERPGWRAAIGFGLCVSLGIASQLIFLFYYAGAATLSAWRVVRGRMTVRSFAALHTLPLAAFAALYLVNLRFLQVGRGDPVDLPLLVAQTLGYSFGLPVLPEWALAYAILATAFLFAGLRLLARENDDEWILVLVAVAIAPFLVLAVLRPEVIALRYFVIGIALSLLLAARLLAGLVRSGGWRRAAGLAALGVFLVGNTVHIARFFVHGRGGYREALTFMAANSPAGRISVGSDHDFRNGTVLRFYKRFLPHDQDLLYHPQGSWPRAGTSWMLIHRAVAPDTPPPTLRDLSGNVYRFARAFEYGGISGFYWAVYRNTAQRDSGSARTRNSAQKPDDGATDSVRTQPVAPRLRSD